MVNRGRPPKNRITELGQYIQERRDEYGWSVHKLAKEAHVPYKTLSKLELGRSVPRHQEIFLYKIAKAFNLHPDQLLLRASLTPMLRVSPDTIAMSTARTISITLLVTEDERRQLENYLQFLRQMASIEALSRTAQDKEHQ